MLTSYFEVLLNLVNQSKSQNIHMKLILKYDLQSNYFDRFYYAVWILKDYLNLLVVKNEICKM